MRTGRVTGIMGLVGDEGREIPACCRFDEDVLDAAVHSSMVERSASTGSLPCRPIARLSEEESIDVFSTGGRLDELRIGNDEGAEVIEGESEPGLLREPGEDREGESCASK